MKQIFINLPVKNLEASMQFYLQLGFTINPLFSFEDQKCMVWTDQIYLMLQNYEMFQKGNQKNLSDPKQNTIASFTLPVESLEILNDIVDSAIKAGGTEPTKMIDEGFMVLRNIEDLDGHLWGIIYLDMEKFKAMTGK